MRRILLLFIIGLAVLSSCKKDEIEETPEPPFTKEFHLRIDSVRTDSSLEEYKNFYFKFIAYNPPTVYHEFEWNHSYPIIHFSPGMESHITSNENYMLDYTIKTDYACKVYTTLTYKESRDKTYKCQICSIFTNLEPRTHIIYDSGLKNLQKYIKRHNGEFIIDNYIIPNE